MIRVPVCGDIVYYWMMYETENDWPEVGFHGPDGEQWEMKRTCPRRAAIVQRARLRENGPLVDLHILVEPDDGYAKKYDHEDVRRHVIYVTFVRHGIEPATFHFREEMEEADKAYCELRGFKDGR